MKTLFLLRHAKAENAAGLSDFDRDLNDRGRREAQAAGEYIKKQNQQLDLVLSSPALRARETAELALASAGLDNEIRFDQRIYEASLSRLLTVLSEVDDRASSLMLVGHNPGLEELIRTLTGRAGQMKPATIASISLNIDQWSSVGENTGTLDWLVKPDSITAER